MNIYTRLKKNKENKKKNKKNKKKNKIKKQLIQMNILTGWLIKKTHT